MSRSVGQNRYRRARRSEVRNMEMQQLMRGTVSAIGASTEPIRRGFFGRLKWLLFGR